MLRSREQLLAELVSLCPAHYRARAEAVAAEYLAISEEIDRRREEKAILEALAEVQVSIKEALANGELMRDRYGRLWPSEWLPVHNGEVAEPEQPARLQ
jgi:hypothetical protein